MNFDDENLPIADLPLLSAGVSGMFDAGQDLLTLLREAKLRPHILDDAIIDRTSQVYSDQKKEIKKYWGSLRLWRAENPPSAEQKALNAFEAALKKVNSMHDEILDQIEFFRPRTVEQVLSQDDVGLTIDSLFDQESFSKTVDPFSPSSVVPSKYIPCEKCGKFIAHIIYAEDSSIENVKHHAAIMRELIAKDNIDAWVISEPLKVQGDEALAYIMKVWPILGDPEKMWSPDFNAIIEELEATVCC